MLHRLQKRKIFRPPNLLGKLDCIPLMLLNVPFSTVNFVLSGIRIRLATRKIHRVIQAYVPCFKLFCEYMRSLVIQHFRRLILEINKSNIRSLLARMRVINVDRLPNFWTSHPRRIFRVMKLLLEALLLVFIELWLVSWHTPVHVYQTFVAM